jgi:His-Xaa-Ser system protein HxsD
VTEVPAHVVEVDESVFPIDVVIKATYWMTGRYTLEVSRDQTRELLIVAVSRPPHSLSQEERIDVEVRLRRDLIDFRTRALIDKETRTLRELLVAKAFAHGDEL